MNGCEWQLAKYLYADIVLRATIFIPTVEVLL
jgi:hypothetical protein